MIISCTNCGTKYSAADSKVVNKKFAFTCPSCENEIIIDNRINKEEEISLKKQAVPAGKTIKDEQPMKKSPGSGKTDLELSLSDEGGLDLAEEKLPTEDVLMDDDLIDNLEFKHGKTSAEAGMSDTELDSIESFEDLSGADDLGSIEVDIDSITVGRQAAKDADELSLDEESEIFEDINLDVEEKPVPLRAAAGKAAAADEFEPDEEELNLNIDDLDIDELSSADDTLLDEDGTALNLLEEEGDMEQLEEKITLDDVKSDEIFSQESAESSSDDTDITIDLDSLDIQLEEIEGQESMLSGEEVDSGDFDLSSIGEPLISEDKKKPARAMKLEEAHEDEDITLDLDSLDLNLDETGETMEGESVEDDERLTLADAGLTPDELVMEKAVRPLDDYTDEELRINIDEVTADISGAMEEESEDLVSFDMSGAKKVTEPDELPEIDLDEFEKEDFLLDEEAEIEPVEEIEAVPAPRVKAKAPAPRPEVRIREIEEIKDDITDTVPAGIVNFSIDYSLKFSRTGALLRLTGLFAIGLIPHMIVNTLYSLLSYILGVINNILIVLTGESVDDYTEIQENSIRQSLSFGACCMGIVEEMPIYSGRKDVDYTLQYDVTYPLKRSRLLAFLRLSVIGIIIITLPHLLLLFILSVGSIPIAIAGLISVLIKKTWPDILFDSMVKYWGYTSTVMSYITGLVDKYPRFKFE